MRANGYEYDSDAVRAEARKFRQCCEDLEARALPRVKSISADLEDDFSGAAADALGRRLSELQEQIRALRGGCGGMYSALMNYAEALERADREVAEMFGN